MFVSFLFVFCSFFSCPGLWFLVFIIIIIFLFLCSFVYFNFFVLLFFGLIYDYSDDLYVQTEATVYQAARLWWLSNRNTPKMLAIKKKSKKTYRKMLVTLVRDCIRLPHLPIWFWINQVEDWNTFDEAKRTLKKDFDFAYKCVSRCSFYHNMIPNMCPRRLSYHNTPASFQKVMWLTPDLRLLNVNGPLKSYRSHIFMIGGYLFTLVIKPHQSLIGPPSCYIGLQFIGCGTNADFVCDQMVYDEKLPSSLSSTVSAPLTPLTPLTPSAPSLSSLPLTPSLSSLPLAPLAPLAPLTPSVSSLSSLSSLSSKHSPLPSAVLETQLAESLDEQTLWSVLLANKKLPLSSQSLWSRSSLPGRPLVSLLSSLDTWPLLTLGDKGNPVNPSMVKVNWNIELKGNSEKFSIPDEGDFRTYFVNQTNGKILPLFPALKEFGEANILGLPWSSFLLQHANNFLGTDCFLHMKVEINVYFKPE
jgi:hypothetical protein